MRDLVEFLTDRLDEREAAARTLAEETGARWTVAREVSLRSNALVVAVQREDGDGSLPIVPPGEYLIYCGPEAEPGAAHLAVHIAEHDPARTLADIAAVRRVIARHQGIHRCDWGELRMPEFWPCTAADLRALAVPYADHPDYDEDWSPTP